MNSLISKSWFGLSSFEAPPLGIGRFKDEINTGNFPGDNGFNGGKWWDGSFQLKDFQQRLFEVANSVGTHETVAMSSIDSNYFLTPIKSAPSDGEKLGQCSSSKKLRLIEWQNGFVDLTILRCSNGIRITTRNDLRSDEIDLVFLQTNEDKMLTAQAEGGISFTVQVNPSDDQIALFTASLWSIKTNVAKMILQGEYGGQAEFLSGIEKGEQTQSMPCQSVNGVHRMTHDMVCSIPIPLILLLSVWFIRIPPDGKFSVFVPSAGGQVPIDVFECCEKHDIELWCSTRRQSFGINTINIDPNSAQAADMRVLSCVIGKIAEAFNDGGWFENAINDIYFLATYTPLIALIYVGGLEASAKHAEDLLNLDRRNDKSCLCGGDEQTVMCDDYYGGRCRDLCKEFGKKQNCTYECKYACEYDDKGRLRKEGGVYQRPIINTTGKPCCQAAIAPCVEKGRCSEQNCTDCKWYCQKCRVWWKDPGCKGGVKAVYGREYALSPFSENCCPEKSSPTGPGSEPRSVKKFCRSEEPDRDTDRVRKIEVIRFP